MPKVRVAFGADKFQKRHENLVALTNEAYKRKNWEVFWFDFEAVYERNGIVYLPLRQIRHKVRLTKKRMLTEGPVIWTDAELMDAIVVKKDPPQSKHTLRLLRKVCDTILMLNDPHSIIRYESKRYLKKLKDVTVPTKFSSSVKELEEYIEKLGNVVVKQERGFGGKGVYHVFKQNGQWYEESSRTKKPRKANLKTLLKHITNNGKEDAVVVKYLKYVWKGDKRIIVFDNEILGSFLRIPGQRKGFICNISSGGTIKKTKLTKWEKHTIHVILDRFKKDQPVMMGVDTLTDDDGRRIVSEVNTSNVGGTYALERLTHKPVSKQIIDWVEKRVTE